MSEKTPMMTVPLSLIWSSVRNPSASDAMSVAAASILAKVSRDRLMLEYAAQYPEYGFEKHKGYGTKLHTDAILKYGETPIHRPGFLKKLYEKNGR